MVTSDYSGYRIVHWEVDAREYYRTVVWYGTDSPNLHIDIFDHEFSQTKQMTLDTTLTDWIITTHLQLSWPRPCVLVTEPRYGLVMQLASGTMLVIAPAAACRPVECTVVSAVGIDTSQQWTAAAPVWGRCKGPHGAMEFRGLLCV